VAIGTLWKVFVYWELGYRQDKERCGRSAVVVFGNWGREGHWLALGNRCDFGDRQTFGVVAEVCRVLSNPEFVTGVEVVVVLVGSIWVIIGTVCAVLGGRYALGGNSQEGGKQRQTASV
jgi:hypothetical protein